ncbi:MAG: zinc-binding dehydrogenase [Acidimicrobiia bacterium]|nr:zinc-binding dehydrogenase [Acidimicrobiia bacterium]
MTSRPDAAAGPAASAVAGEQVRNHRIVVSRRGEPDVMLVVQEDVPEPQHGEARVKVAAAGVSAFDLMIRSIWFPGNPSPPFTPGEDVVGVVDELGDGVSTLEPGQMVAGWTFGDGGGYSEYVCRPASQLVPVPTGLDPAAAVTLVVNYLTAHLYLHQTGHVTSGERILVHGAAGGLGSALLQLGSLADLEMYGTASEHNHDLVRALGATPIDYRNEDFVERIRALTGDGVDAVFDTVSGPRQLWRSYRTLRAGGRLVPIGSVATSSGGMKVIPLSLLTIGLLRLVPDRKRVPLSPTMMRYPHRHNTWYRETLAGLLAAAADGELEPVVAERVPLTEAARAHELLGQGGHAGKVVLIAHP